MLVFLATRALERINELRTRRSALEEQRRQLQAQLRALRGHAQGLRPLLSTNDADERRAAVLEQRLLQTEEELVAARKPLGTLDDYLEQIRQVLSQPEIYLQVHSLALRFNRLGVRLPPDSPEPGETLVTDRVRFHGGAADRRFGAVCQGGTAAGHHDGVILTPQLTRRLCAGSMP
jgi:hypothetical protein